MHSSVERLEGDRARITITVPAADVDRHIADAYATIASQLRIPGFRPGKAPRPVVDTHVGREAVLAEAQEGILSDSYGRAISAEGLRTIGQPDTGELDLPESGADYTYTAEVALRPELTLASAENFAVTVPSRVASDAEIDAHVESVRERFATLEASEGPVAVNDFALVSFVGTVDGEAYEGNTVDQYLYELGRGLMPEEFDQALVGTSSGASTVAEFVIPDTTSNPEFAGKPARFEIDVHEVKTKVLPELDDAFAASAGGFDTLEEYRADVREKLELSKTKRHDANIETALLTELVSRLIGDAPQEMIDARANTMLRELFEEMERRGITIEQYMQAVGVGPEQLQADLAAQAGVRVREELALEALHTAKQIEISEADIEQGLLEIAGGDAEAAVALREELTDNGALPLVREQIVHKQALQWLLTNATITEEESS